MIPSFLAYYPCTRLVHSFAKYFECGSSARAKNEIQFYLCIERVAEYDTQLLGVLLGLAGLRGVEHGGLDAAGERLAEQLGGELDGARNLLEMELPARLFGHG